VAAAAALVEHVECFNVGPRRHCRRGNREYRVARTLNVADGCSIPLWFCVPYLPVTLEVGAGEMSWQTITS
jgi:hypothetical protein